MSFRLIIQIIVSLLLATLILIQSQGTGLGSTWGGSNTHYRSKKGLEKLFFTLTIILGLIFISLSLLNTIL